jgi:hypothetical protein
MSNPFRYGTVVSGEDFCGRQELIDQLTGYIETGQNVVLQGERRIGKTSLAVETVRRMKKHRMLRVNLMEVKSVDTLCKRVLHAILAFERSGSKFDRLMKSLAYLRPTLGLNPITGEPSVSFDSLVQLHADSIPEVLTLVENLHREKPLVVFLDEFQDVLRVEEDPRGVLAQLRGTIQHQADIPYLFAGSIRNRMDEIFNHPDSPFFKSALTLTVGPLSGQDFADHLVKKFQTGNRTIHPIVLEKIFKMTDGVTGDIQQFCESLWTISKEGESIGEEKILEALRLIFAREQKSYEVILARLTASYVRILQTLAELGGEQPTASAFVRRAAVSNPSAIPPALKRMAEQKIVFHDGHRWRFTNSFFGAWLLSREEI